MIDNLTPFGADTAFGYDLDDTQMVVLCVAGRFRMPPAGETHDGVLQLVDEQPSPPMADIYWADPAESSLHQAGQGVVRRPGAEFYLQGSAWAPRGRPVTEMRTRVSAGPCSKEVHVVGDRHWVRGLIGMKATAPHAFVSMPLLYERSFGGTARSDDGRILVQESCNPVGRGVYSGRRDAMDRALPNLEKPGQRIKSWKAKATPWGYGPIPGSWQPRLRLAGTYDQEWVEKRIPLWPQDIDPRFFCAAAPGLNTTGPLYGGEPVVLEGFSPDGVFRFRLPEYRILAKSIYGDRTVRYMMQIEGVLFEPDERSLTLFWRRSVPLGYGPRLHVRSIIRLLEPWESNPV
jgi:hypothetical protein